MMVMTTEALAIMAMIVARMLTMVVVAMAMPSHWSRW